MHRCSNEDFPLDFDTVHKATSLQRLYCVDRNFMELEYDLNSNRRTFFFIEALQ